MHRLRNKATSFSPGLDEWKNVGWEVILTVNSRQAVTAVAAIARRVLGPDLCFYGSAEREIGPFDSLHDTVRDLLVDSALSTLDAMMDHEEAHLPGFEPR